jgi:cytochrome c553
MEGKMKIWLLVATALAFGAAAGVGTAVQAADAPPPWAYGFTTPVPPGTPPAEPNPQQVLDNVTLHTLPGSKFSFTRAEIANRYGPADWFPEDHPAMPEIVAKGKVSAQPQVYACSLCHYPNGKGRPENANITGLTYEYFVQQMLDFRNGARKTSDPRKANTGLMTRFAKMMTEDEIKAAAHYFTAIPATSWITVVESATVPKTKPQNGMFLRLEGEEAGAEPIGERIIEMPEKTHDTEFLRNSRSGFIAYVPPGSLKKGEALYRVPEIVTLGRFPDARESDSTWRTKEVRHVGSDTIAPRFWCVASARFGEEDERRPPGPSASGSCSDL